MSDNTDVGLQRDPDDALDRMLRNEMCWQVPTALTHQLLSLIPGAPALVPQQAIQLPQQRPQHWYVMLVTGLTILSVIVSMLVAWQFYGEIGSVLGLPEMWRALAEAPRLGMARLFEALPQARYLLTMLEGVRNYLYWLLLVAVLWVALDGWSPSISLRRQQV